MAAPSGVDGAFGVAGSEDESGKFPAEDGSRAGAVDLVASRSGTDEAVGFVALGVCGGRTVGVARGSGTGLGATDGVRLSGDGFTECGFGAVGGAVGSLGGLASFARGESFLSEEFGDFRRRALSVSDFAVAELSEDSKCSAVVNVVVIDVDAVRYA